MHARFVPSAVIERMAAVRREIAQRLEVANEESSPLAAVEQALRDLGLAPETVDAAGCVADIPGRHDGRCVALRAIVESSSERQNGATVEANGGAGADAAMLVGAAALLLREPPDRPVRLIVQVADERLDGARKLLEAGALEGVSCIFGAQSDPHDPAGVIAVGEGVVNASTDVFRIHVQGRTGHGGRPHEAVDAIVLSGLLVVSLQTIVSREVDPAHPTVLTVGRLTAGSTPYGIAGRAELEGTIRACDLEVRAHLIRSLQRIASAIGVVHDARIDVEVTEGAPALVHDDAIANVAKEAARETCGASGVVPLRAIPMNGDDFARFVRLVPGGIVRVGSHPGARGSEAGSNTRADFDERALTVGAAWLDRIARIPEDRIPTGPDGDEAA